MTTYNTGNPIGSTDARDLYDNAQNFDTAVNTSNPVWVDRLGNARTSLVAAAGFVIDTPWLNAEDFATLAEADAAAAAANKQLVISTVWDIAAATTLTSAIKVLPGGGFNGTGALTISGPFEAGLYPVFAGTGTVSGLNVARPEWFGAYGDGTHATETTSAISNALASAPTLDFGTGRTYLTNGVELKSYSKIIGTSTLKFVDNGALGAFYNNNKNLANVLIDGITFDAGGVTFLGSINQNPRIINLQNTGNLNIVSDITLSKCKFKNLKIDSIYSYGGANKITVIHCEFYGDISDGTYSLADGVRLETSYSTVGYGTAVHTGVSTIGCYSYNVRTLADYKRGTADSVIENNIAIDSTDVAYSIDNAFNIIAVGNYAKNSTAFTLYASASNLRGFEVQGEKILISNNILIGGDNTVSRGIMISQYGHPSDTYHQSKNIIISNNIVDYFYQGVRLIDTANCTIKNNTITNTGAQRITLEHSAASNFNPSGNVVDGNFTDGGFASSVDTTSRWINNSPNLFSTGTSFSGQTFNRLLFSNPHLDITAGVINNTTGGESVVAGSSLPPDYYIHQSALLSDTNTTGLAAIALNRLYPVPTIHVGLWIKNISATPSSLLFQEYDSSNTFLKSTYVDLVYSATWKFVSVSYLKTSANWAYTKVSIVPATNYNNPSATGSCEIAGLIVSDTIVGSSATMMIGA